MSSSPNGPSFEEQDNGNAASPDTRSLRPMSRAWIHAVSSVVSPLRVRNYRLLFAGQLISNVGDIFYAVALPWFMLSNGGGAQALGIVLTAYGLPRVGSVLLGGALSDRFQPRQVMLLADSMRTLLMGMLAGLVAAGHPALWMLCTVSALVGIFDGLFIPAAWSVVPSLLTDDVLQAGNALTTSSTQVAGIVGAGIAGVVVAWLQPAGALAIDALTFVVSAGTLAAIREKQEHSTAQQDAAEKMEGAPASEGTGQEISPPVPRTFWRLLRTSRYLQITLILVIFMNLGSGGTLEVALPAFAHDQLKAAASGYGFMLAGFAIGALIGAVVAGGLGRIPYRYLIALSCFLIQAGAMTLVPFLGSVAAASCSMVIAGAMNSLGNVILVTQVQQIFPRHLMGRIMSAFALTNFGLYPLSVAVAGIIVAHYGPIAVFVMNGVLVAVPCIIGGFQRELREL
jgi:MFS family permease